MCLYQTKSDAHLCCDNSNDTPAVTNKVKNNPNYILIHLKRQKIFQLKEQEKEHDGARMKGEERNKFDRIEY